MTTLWLDTETFSETPITHGTHAYAEKAEVLLVALALDDEPVVVWDTSDPERRGSQLAALQGMIDRADEVVIHNSHFDRTVLRHGGVTVPTHKIIDTMVLALQHSLPGSLGALCDVLQVPQDKAKDVRGKKLIQLFTKPRPKNMKLRRADSASHPEEWQEFIEYARLDVDAMRAVYRRLPRWNDSHSERALWLIDQRINDAGVAVDLDLAGSALRAFKRASRSLADAAGVLTGGEVGSLTQRQKLLDHLADKHDFTPADLTKGTGHFNVSLGAVATAQGIGASVEAIQQNFALGPIAQTGSALDVAVNGDGFFTTVSPITSQTYYTRNGSFSTDGNGFVVDGSGNQLQAFAVNASGAVTSTTPAAAQIPPTNAAGAQFAGVTVGANGDITASYADGTNSVVGRIALASFVAPAGLKQVGSSNWVSTGISGSASYGQPGSAQYGSLLSGALERSNVDIAEELVGLITAQRDFQANAKAIDTATQISQTVINLRN